MANRILTTNFLTRESNANHDGTTQQISDRLTGFATDNAMLTAAVQGVTSTRQAEDIAFKRFSGKDFASDDLKKEDGLEDKYMSATMGILNGLLILPETEPIYRKAQLARQVFKDFGFATSDGFEAEARKTINMAQQFRSATEYTMAELGIDQWVTKAEQQANKVLQLITTRIDNESAKVKGELAAARQATDEAIRKAYDILNALAVLQPTAELTALINVLFSIEDRAKQYYINSGKKPGGSTGTGTGTNPNPNDNPGTTDNPGTGTTDPGTGTTDPGTGTTDPGTGTTDPGTGDTPGDSGTIIDGVDEG